MADLERLLRADISHAAAEAAEAPDFGSIEHRGTRRRRSHTMVVAAAAAVVIALVAVGSSLVLDDQSTSPAPASPRPPSPRFGTMPSGDGTKSEVIDPGPYRIPSSAWSAVDFTIEFPVGWTVQYGHIYHHEPNEGLSLEAAVVDGIFTDACRGSGVPLAVGPGVEDLVTALRTQRGPVARRPVTTTVGGYPATRVDLRIPRGLDLESCRLADVGAHGLQIWYTQPTDNYFVLFPGAVASVYVVDVDGRRQVFVGQNRLPDSRKARAELQQVLDSIRIEG